MHTPYLSIVVTGRNDNHGEKFLDRLQMFVASLNQLARIYRELSLELVFVEWAPPDNTLSIRESINWERSIKTRILRVPRSLIDRKYSYLSETREFDQWIAKNAGILRAEGSYVLCCNPDLVFPLPLFEWLATKQLTDDVFYRATRIDIRPLSKSFDEYKGYKSLIESCVSGIFSANMIYNNEADLDGNMYQRILTENTALDLFGEMQMHLNSFHRFPNTLLRGKMYLCHTMASGDFTLMSRDQWIKLRGYLEIGQKAHVDSVAIHRCVSELHMDQVVLPFSMCQFHQDHQRSEYVEFPEGLKLMEEYMNSNDWGFSNEHLEIIDLSML